MLVLLYRDDVPIGPERAAQQGEQLRRSEVRLFLVVVDVVIRDDLAFRRLPWLPRPQDNTRAPVIQLLPNVLHNLKPGMLGLHNHIQQDQRGVLMIRQNVLRLGAGITTDETQPATRELEIRQRQLGDIMHPRIIVDDDDLPFGLHGMRTVEGSGIRLLRSEDKGIIINHRRSPT